MNELQPGSDGEPLPEGTLIFRIGESIKISAAAERHRKALPEIFELSTRDKNSEGKRLSVWIEELTVADQGWDFMGAKPKNTVVVCLNVDSIRSLQPPDSFEPLDVEWEQAKLDDDSPNTKPGAEGHAGVTGLLQGGNGKVDRNNRKKLRMRLADIAEVSPGPVPHDIPEDYLRVAAYFVFEKDDVRAGSQESHWISAIRQLRRARVQQHKQSL